MALKRMRASKKDGDTKSSSNLRKRASKRANTAKDEPVEMVEVQENSIARFLDEPIPESEAKTLWPDRYKPIEKPKAPSRKKKDDVEEIIQARCHFRRAIVDECHTYELNDDAYVQAGEGNNPFICKIVEMFEGANGKLYFTAQWFYRAADTVIGKLNVLISNKRVFFSEVRDTNELGTLVKKLEILMISLNENTEETIAATKTCDYYCDMNYLLPYSTFEALQHDTKIALSESSTISSDIVSEDEEASQATGAQREATLLDLYCGCGAMSTGLCMGAQLAGLNLATKWAVDMNAHACKSLEHNHPETQVRNLSAEDFLLLLKEWEKLCIHFSLRKCPNSEEHNNLYGMTIVEDNEDGSKESDNEDDGEVFTVEKIVGISFGDPKMIKKRGLYLKVRWLGYEPLHDTWEPIEGLSNCREKIKEFVEHGYESCILPLPGGVDVVCGGPPCQGISGHNRHRNEEQPLEDEKNMQLLVYMNIVEFLKPKYVLMENVVDMLKFAKGYLARYAVGRLVQMNYQSRMGMMAAGAYGLAQFRMRFFLWGALSSEMLPQFPLPTHDVVMRGVIPVEFERNTVAYDEGHTVKLADKLLLKDVISDLPAVANSELRDEMRYDKDPETPFQQFIRLRKDEVLGSLTKSKSKKHVLYDHHPLKLNIDDYQRVCRVPKRKGANFRDFPGLIVGPDNVVHIDESVERVKLESGNPLVPEYAVNFVRGTSSKPFGRLWWDETVPTVVTRAEPHNQVIIHPQQDRVLSIRENARLQGFPDYYKLFGPTKQKYTQVGNAVAVPVAKALGYALGIAFRGLTVGDDPLLTLPEGFATLKPNLPSELA
uniref:Cytosine-specific methyltransferase n=1 Tax=Boechera holboellii TaxID=93890 RepID=A0A1Q1N5E4_BOEHO|nr:chromomethylase 3 [Boechera holboellii]